jgi:hypothetical protein
MNQFSFKNLACLFVVNSVLVLMPSQAYANDNDDDDNGTQAPLATVGSGKVNSRGLDKAHGDVRWILPGPWRLDPKIFGTPAAPLGFEPDVGVPLAARLTTPDGSAYTTTAGPTPFSNNFAVINGSYRLKAEDNSLAEVTSPVPTGFLLPNGVEQPFIHVMFESVRVSDSDEDRSKHREMGPVTEGRTYSPPQSAPLK